MVKHKDRHPEKLWNLPPWRFSKCNWTRPSATWSSFDACPAVSRGLDQKLALLADLRDQGGSHTALQPDVVWCTTAYGRCSIWVSRSIAPEHKTTPQPSSSTAWGNNCKRRAARDRPKEEVIVLKHQLHWRQYLSWLNRAGFDLLCRSKSAAFTISPSCWYPEVRGIS